MTNRFTAVAICLLMASACLTTGESGGCGRQWSAPPCGCPSEETGDASAPAEATSPRSGGRVRVRITSEPTTLLSMLDPDPSVRRMIDLKVLEPLVRISADGTVVEPALAESWNEDETGKTYTFSLASDARWHDGRPVTSTDIQYTFAALLDPDGQSPMKGELADVAEVEIRDDTTIALHLDEPRIDFLFALASLPILPQHVFGRTPLAEHPAARAPVGSGPYRFVRWQPGRSIELARNPDWRGAPPHLDEIEYRIIADNRVAIDLFRRGDLDIVPGLPGGTDLELDGGRVITYPLPRFRAWIYNTARPMFARPATRLALGLMIDRAVIRCSILQCKADLVESPWPPEHLSPPDTPAPLLFDPARARELLESDGWEDRDGDGIRERGGVPFSFSLLLPDRERELSRTAAVVRSDLARAGIEMRVATVSATTYQNRLRARRFDASIITVATSTVFDPWSRFHGNAIGAGDNFGSFEDAATDALLDQLRGNQGTAARREVMVQLSGKLREEQPVTFTFRPHAAVVVRDSVRGVAIARGWFDERALWRADVAKGESR